MFSLFKKEKNYSEPFRMKKELRLLPGYLLLLLWIFFAVVLFGWVLIASFAGFCLFTHLGLCSGGIRFVPF